MSVKNTRKLRLSNQRIQPALNTFNAGDSHGKYSRENPRYFTLGKIALFVATKTAPL